MRLTSLQAQFIRAGDTFATSTGDKTIARALAKKGLITIKQGRHPSPNMFGFPVLFYRLSNEALALARVA